MRTLPLVQAASRRLCDVARRRVYKLRTLRLRPTTSLPKSSHQGPPRQKRPVFKQHFLNRFCDPQGQRSFRPSFSSSSLSPWTMRTPRFTWRSDGNPLRRLLIGSKKVVLLVVALVVWLAHVSPSFQSRWSRHAPSTETIGGKKGSDEGGTDSKSLLFPTFTAMIIGWSAITWNRLRSPFSPFVWVSHAALNPLSEMFATIRCHRSDDRHAISLPVWSQHNDRSTAGARRGGRAMFVVRCAPFGGSEQLCLLPF